MSDSSSDDEPRRTRSEGPVKKRRKLKPMMEEDATKEVGLTSGGGILTEVSMDYGDKLRKAEVETFVKKSKLAIDAKEAVHSATAKRRLGPFSCLFSVEISYIVYCNHYQDSSISTDVL